MQIEVIAEIPSCGVSGGLIQSKEQRCCHGSKIRWLSFKSLRNQITSIRVVFAEIADLSLGASRLRIRFLHKLPVLATQIPGTGVSVLARCHSASFLMQGGTAFERATKMTKKGPVSLFTIFGV